MSLRLSFALISSVAAGGCGDGNGEHCGSWFSHFSCPGKCCHDDFNTWCCPTGPWECSGSFEGGSHCDVTNACHCTDKTYFVTKVEAAGEPTIVADPGWDLTECCDLTGAGDSQCGWSSWTTVSWTRQTQMTWSESLEVTDEITMKESLLVEGMEAKITLKESFTRGSTKSESIQQTLATPCGGTYNSTTFLRFKSNIALYTVPVKITYENCGEQITAPGTVTSSVANGNYRCTQNSCSAGCDQQLGCVDNIVGVV